jgi:preprotein translocase subunit YajC
VGDGLSSPGGEARALFAAATGSPSAAHEAAFRMVLALENCTVLLAEQPAGGQGSIIDMLPFFSAMMILFYFLILRPENRKRTAARAMVEQLKKNDRVLTAGGVYGVVTNVNREADRVTVRVDEANNTRIDVSLGAITRVISDEQAVEKEKTAKT